MSFRTKEPLMLANSELVIGLVAPVGTDIQSTMDTLQSELRLYDYEPFEIHVSELFQYFTGEESQNDEDETEFAKRKRLINLGNSICKDFESSDILAYGVIYKIGVIRAEKAENKRKAYIIRSLKRPEEVNLLRSVYGDGFYLIGVLSDQENRKNALQADMTSSEADEIINTDEHESVNYGQNTREAFHLSDFFLSCNKNSCRLNIELKRFIGLIFGNPYITPTFDEYAMFIAFASALRSADLSRQVGAVITKDNEILGTGVNEVPCFNGGQYWSRYDESRNDYVDAENGRDYKKGYDSNTTEKIKIIEDIIGKCELSQLENESEIKIAFKNAIKKSRLNDITEYGRPVHAEMEAILSCARKGISIKGSNLYATTFPCHNCAKHIVSSGIHRVVFIEPYPKSKALELHSDSISQISDQSGTHVIFEPFIGVGPRKFFDLFSINLGSGRPIERKEKTGEIVKITKKKSELRLPLDVKSYLGRERFLCERIDSLLKEREKKLEN